MQKVDASSRDRAVRMFLHDPVKRARDCPGVTIVRTHRSTLLKKPAGTREDSGCGPPVLDPCKRDAAWARAQDLGTNLSLMGMPSRDRAFLNDRTRYRW